MRLQEPDSAYVKVRKDQRLAHIPNANRTDARDPKAWFVLPTMLCLRSTVRARCGVTWVNGFVCCLWTGTAAVLVRCANLSSSLICQGIPLANAPARRVESRAVTPTLHRRMRGVGVLEALGCGTRWVRSAPTPVRGEARRGAPTPVRDAARQRPFQARRGAGFAKITWRVSRLQQDRSVWWNGRPTLVSQPTFQSRPTTRQRCVLAVAYRCTSVWFVTSAKRSSPALERLASLRNEHIAREAREHARLLAREDL